MKRIILLSFCLLTIGGMYGQNRRAMLGGAQDTWSIDNIISAWKFDGSLIDEVGGNNAYKQGTLDSYVDGLGGRQAGKNQGYGHRFRVNDADNLSFTDGVNNKPFSITMLFKLLPTDLEGTQHYFWKKSIVNTTTNTPGQIEYALSIRNNLSLRVEIFGTYSVSLRSSTGSLDAFVVGEWHHIGVSFYPTMKRVEVYIDGQPLSLSREILNSQPMVNGDGQLVVLGSAQRNESASSTFGYIQDFYIWDKTLGPKSMLDIATKQLAGIDILP